MKTLFLVAILVIASTLSLYSQSSCLCIPRDIFMGVPNSYNADSVFAIDTCLVPNSVACDSILSLDRQAKYQVGLYTKRFNITFNEFNYIPLPTLPADSLVFVTWQQIDTSFPETRAGFSALEARFGSFLIRKIRPSKTDLSDVGSRVYVVYFPNFQFADSVLEYIQSIAGISTMSPVPVFTDNQTAVKEPTNFQYNCESIIACNGTLTIPEIAQKCGWRLVNIVGQTVKEFAPESYNDTVTLNNLNAGVYFAIFPTCTSLILLTGDNQ